MTSKLIKSTKLTYTGFGQTETSLKMIGQTGVSTSRAASTIANVNGAVRAIFTAIIAFFVFQTNKSSIAKQALLIDRGKHESNKLIGVVKLNEKSKF